jgi:hypothetical protein
MCSGGGQCIHLASDGEWNQQNLKKYDENKYGSIIETGIIDVKYKEPQEEYNKNYFPNLDELNNHKNSIKYKIRKGPHMMDGDYIKSQKQVFAYRLEFEESPFPNELKYISIFNVLEYDDPIKGHLEKLKFYSQPLLEEDYQLKKNHEKKLKLIYKPVEDFGRHYYKMQREENKYMEMYELKEKMIFSKSFSIWEKYYDFPYCFSYEV